MSPIATARRLIALALVGLAGPVAAAEPTTVCTITVNSADEREIFREYLPGDRYRFVELAERGRREWLDEACRRGVRCDVLLVSGHFAGTDFYSSSHGEHVAVDEMERIACSDSCPGLFSQLKEVYLFGCDTLKPEPVRSAMPEIVAGLVRAGHSRDDAERVASALSARHGESARDRMRRIFHGVPLIYGFSSLAPYGRVAGPMLRRHFETGDGAHVGSGVPSEALLGLFGPASMVATQGQRAGERHADYRAEACRYYDDRVGPAERVAFAHGLLGGGMPQVRMNFDRIERFFAGLSDADRQSARTALEALQADSMARDRYLAVARDTGDAALRVRMVALARRVGWLSPDGHRAELARMIGDLIAAPSTGFSEVELVCGLNRDGSLDAHLPRFDLGPSVLRRPGAAAALACLGSREGHARMLEALSSADEREVQVAQSYLRHRPLADGEELRAAVRRVGAMVNAPAQSRALQVLARHHIADGEVLRELAELFARTRSLEVQRAVAEVFLRSGPAASVGVPLAELLRRHRLRSPDGEDLIDVLIRRSQAS